MGSVSQTTITQDNHKKDRRMKKNPKNNNHGNPFTRGSQVFSHGWRMLIQGIKTMLIVSIAIALAWIILRFLQKASFKDLYYWICYGWANVKHAVLSIFFDSEEITITYYSEAFKNWQYVKATAYLNDFWMSNHAKNGIMLWHWLKSHALIEAMMAFVAGMILSGLFFIRRGRKKMVKAKIRGNDLVEPKELTQQLKKNKEASDIRIDGLPLVKNSENQHILITGGTGSGKTNLYHEVIPQLQARGDKLIFLDMKGTFFSAYYDEEKDKFLNPTDERSLLWLPWADCDMSFEYDAMANAMAGKPSSSESIWEETPRKVIAMALEKNRGTRSIEEFMNLLNRMSFKDYAKFFKDTDVSTMTAVEADRTATSIRATISNKVKSFSYLQETDQPFSIKRYILDDNDKGSLFITVPSVQRETLLPILSAWIEVALKSLMQRDLTATKKKKNIWFIMDELPAMGYLPSLTSALAECREFGGCVMAGIQNIHQLMRIYGREQAFDILDQFSSRFIFRCGDKETAEFSAQNLGEQETKETQESLSYGANTVRDGVNLNVTERIKKLVLPTEIMTLNKGCCYVKLAGSYPITKLPMRLNKVKMRHKISMIRQDLYLPPLEAKS